MRDRFWILGVVFGVVVLAAVLYFSTGAEQAAQTEYAAPTPTNALPGDLDRYVRIIFPSVTATVTPTPSTGKVEATVKQEIVIGDRSSAALTYNGILEVDFQERDFTRLEDCRVTSDDDSWEAIYDIPSVCTAMRFRFAGTTLFEQLGAVREETTEYYSYFSGTTLKKNDELVVLSVPVARETDGLTLFLRSDEVRVMQNGYILAEICLRDGTVKFLLATDGHDDTDYSRTLYVAEDGRLEGMYLEETDDQVYCFDRRTHRLEWHLSRSTDGERTLLLEARDPNSPEDEDNMVVLYRGEPEMMPDEVYGVTNTSVALSDRIRDAEAGAAMPKNEWEEKIHTSILADNEFGVLYMDSVFCGYLQADEKGKEKIQGTVLERRFHWENKEFHMYMENVVADPECAIDIRTVIDDPEYTQRYLLRSYEVSDRRSRSRAETMNNELLWVEEAMTADGVPYRVVRTYPDHIRVRDLSQGNIYYEEITDFSGKRIRRTQYIYEDNRILKTETRDGVDNLIETRDYIYEEESWTLLKSVVNRYDVNGNLTGTVYYDAAGNEIRDN